MSFISIVSEARYYFGLFFDTENDNSEPGELISEILNSEYIK